MMNRQHNERSGQPHSRGYQGNYGRQENRSHKGERDYGSREDLQANRYGRETENWNREPGRDDLRNSEEYRGRDVYEDNDRDVWYTQEGRGGNRGGYREGAQGEYMPSDRDHRSSDFRDRSLSQSQGYYDDRGHTRPAWNDRSAGAFSQGGYGASNMHDRGRYGQAEDWNRGFQGGMNDRSRYEESTDWNRGFQGSVQDRGWSQSGYGQSQFGGYGQGQFGGYGQGQSGSDFESESRTGRGPKGYQRSDERIREDVCDRLAGHGRLDASEVEVQVSEGEVTLTGTVARREDKRMIEDIAESIQGVQDVTSQIRVKRDQSRSSKKQNGGSEKQNTSSESTTGMTYSAADEKSSQKSTAASKRS